MTTPKTPFQVLQGQYANPDYYLEAQDAARWKDIRDRLYRLIILIDNTIKAPTLLIAKGTRPALHDALQQSDYAKTTLNGLKGSAHVIRKQFGINLSDLIS